VKLVASGAVDDSLLEALEDYVKRQRKRLNIGVPRHALTGETPPKTILGSVGDEEVKRPDDDTESPIKRRKIG
jgi:hypothetical protein